jgi:DNA-directed RNA polymerase specialized sigma54-like protein
MKALAFGRSEHDEKAMDEKHRKRWPWSQQLAMSPQLEQAIKILQLSLPELEALVQSELDTNSTDQSSTKRKRLIRKK